MLIPSAVSKDPERAQGLREIYRLSEKESDLAKGADFVIALGHYKIFTCACRVCREFLLPPHIT